METITKTIPVLSSLQEVWGAVGNHQVTGQELLNERTYIEGIGWTEISIPLEFRREIARNISEMLGGRQWTKDQVYRVLLGQRPQHWGLSRFLLSNYGKGPRLSYCAGQDQTWESNAIRTYLKNL